MPGLAQLAEQEQEQEQEQERSSGLDEVLYSIVGEQDRTLLENVLNIQLGDRLEVLWHIEVENEDSSSQTLTRWWGCQLIGPAVAEGEAPCPEALMKDSQQRQIWRVLYDSEEGFDQEMRDVVFTEQGELYDVQEQGYLPWRLEGEFTSDEESMGMEEDELVDVQQLANLGEDMMQLEEEAMSWMSTLPADQQLRIASSIRDYIDHVVQGIQGITQEGNNVITREHVQDINRRFREGR